MSATDYGFKSKVILEEAAFLPVPVCQSGCLDCLLGLHTAVNLLKFIHCKSFNQSIDTFSSSSSSDCVINRALDFPMS